MIDYVLNYTNQKNLQYIGHSMGTTVLLTLLSMKPEYNAKIKLGILLAPIAFWKRVSPVIEHFLNKVPIFQVKKYENWILNEIKTYFIY